MLISTRMETNVVSATPDMTIQVADSLMKQEKIHRLPVLDAHNRLVGIVSEKDILKATPSPISTLSAYEMNALLSQLTVAKIMKKNPVTISKDASVEEAARIMIDENISCLPVLDGKKLVGIVSKTDMLKMVLEMLGTRVYGITAECLLENKPGVLAKLSDALAKQNIQIVSFVVLNGPDPSKAHCTIKVQGPNKKAFTEIIKKYVAEVIDVRDM